MIWRPIKDLKYKLHDIKYKKDKLTTQKSIIYNHKITFENIKCSRLHPWHSIKIQLPNVENNEDASKCMKCKTNNIICKAKMEDRYIIH